MAKKKLTVAPSYAFTNENIENFENCDTVSDTVNDQCN